MKFFKLTLVLTSLLLFQGCGEKEKKTENESVKIGTKKAEKKADDNTVKVGLAGDDTMKFDKTEIKVRPDKLWYLPCATQVN